MQVPTIRQLEYLVAVADEGQFNRAADACSVSQPALSKQVRTAEELLGVQVFERSRPRVLLTEVGARIVEQARRVLSEAREVGEIARAWGDDLSGTVYLGVIPTVAPYVIPLTMPALSAEFPDLDIVLHEAKTDVLVDMATGGDLDLVLMAFPVQHGNLVGTDLFCEPFVLAAPDGHELGEQRSVHVDELVGRELMLMDEGHCFRDQALEFCTRINATESSKIRATSLTTLCSMTQNGIGATLVPASAVGSEFAHGRDVVLRAFEAKRPERRIGLRWRPSHPRTAGFERLAAVIREAMLDADVFGGVRVFGPESDMRGL